MPKDMPLLFDSGVAVSFYCLVNIDAKYGSGEMIAFER
jgi:hypothetical protein